MTLAIIIAVLIMLLFQCFFEVAYVNGKSMEPTFQNGDVLLLKKWGVPKKDDIIIAYIEELNLMVVKRILAIEGDVVSIDESGVCVIQGFWFLIYFWPLRIYAGGYHADTEKRCYFLSTLMEIVIFLIAHFFDFTRGMGVILITFTLMVIIFSMTPQDTENRRLSDKEKIIYKKKVNEILAFHIISFAMMYLIDKKEIWEIILLSQALMAFILIVGYMKEILNSKENENATTKAC